MFVVTKADISDVTPGQFAAVFVVTTLTRCFCFLLLKPDKTMRNGIVTTQNWKLNLKKHKGAT